MKIKITIIGSGNVATHLALTFYKIGFKIEQIFSRNIENAKVLSSHVEAEPIDNLFLLNNSSDLYIISVSDSTINDVLVKMPNVNGIVVHTAGSVGLEVLNKFNKYGVFYPFQTFTKEKEIDFQTIPLLVEASSNEVLKFLKEIAGQLSGKVIEADTIQRKNVHLAAVFASNFVNHLYSIADNLLKSNNISFDILMPLIKETTDKALSMNPVEAQTGPAQREDFNIIDNHLEMLKNNQNEFDIYRLLTESVILYKNSKVK